MPIRVVDTVCDYCKEEIRFADKGIIVVNGNVAHQSCAERAGDVQEFMEAPEPTWEQQQYLAADKQTAEHLYNTEQFMEVCVHIGSMFSLTREQALVKPAHYTWKEQADACMKLAHI